MSLILIQFTNINSLIKNFFVDPCILFFITAHNFTCVLQQKLALIVNIFKGSGINLRNLSNHITDNSYKT